MFLQGVRMTKKKFLLSNVMQTKVRGTTYDPLICNFDVLSNFPDTSNKQRIYLWVASNSNASKQEFKIKGCPINSPSCNQLSQMTVGLQSGATIYFSEYDVKVQTIDVWRQGAGLSNFYISLNGGNVRIKYL